MFAFGPLTYGRTLQVLKDGPGTGTVSGGSVAAPTAISCGSTCSASFPNDTEVVLTQAPDTGSTFDHWTGCDSVVSGTCHVTMSEHKVVTATFVTRKLTVSKTGSGSGSIVSDPAGISCGSTCESYFPDGAEVTLTPSAEAGSKFHSWSGDDCDVVGDDCTVTMDGDHSVIATFVAEPEISATNVTGVGPSTAVLSAKINPGGSLTTWHFEYVDDATYAIEGFDNATRDPASDASAGAGTANVPVSRTIIGLEPDTAYHFRLVATNFASSEDGTAGPEVVFTTYIGTPASPACDNDEFRIGPSAKLPDCRAYEQASPVDKNGQEVHGLSSRMAASADGNSVLYFALNGQMEGGGPQSFPYYLAHRDADGWSAQGLLPPISYGNTGGLRGWLPDLSTVFLGVGSLSGAGANFLARSGVDGTLTTISTGGPDATFVGSSADGSIAYLSGGSPLTADAVAGKNNVYAWDRDANTLVLAGVLPDSACGSPPCAPAGGSAVQVGDPGTGPFDNPASNNYPVESHAVSESGDVYFSDAGTGQLYLHKDPFGSPATVRVSVSERTDCAEDPTCGGDDEADPLPDLTLPATFQTATPDGAHAFFTSREELTDESNTSPPVDPPGIAQADLPDGVAPPPCDTEPCNVNKALLPLLGEGESPGGVAADDEHLYWASPSTDSIGRSELNGAVADLHFIDLATGSSPQNVTIDSGKIYWTSASDQNPGTGSIGRADLNGSGAATNIESHCITGADGPIGIDVANGFAYWANYSGDGFGSSIGRANISSTCAAANADANSSDHQRFIGAGVIFFGAKDVVVDSTYVYSTRSTGVNMWNIADGSEGGPNDVETTCLCPALTTFHLSLSLDLISTG